MKNILIIKAGSTFEEILEAHGEFDQMVAKAIQTDRYFVVDVEKGEELPDISDIAGIIMTGSHSMVSEKADWSEKTASWLKLAVDANVPYYGICYGHQLLAHALGGEAGYNPKGLEIGTAKINQLGVDDPLFSQLPESFDAHVIHMQSALKIPVGAVRLAENEHDNNHAFRVGAHAWGVQFHPEFSADIIRGYVQRYKDKIDFEQISANIKETPEATSMLRLFADYCFSLV